MEEEDSAFFCLNSEDESDEEGGEPSDSGADTSTSAQAPAPEPAAAPQQERAAEELGGASRKAAYHNGLVPGSAQSAQARKIALCSSVPAEMGGCYGCVRRAFHSGTHDIIKEYLRKHATPQRFVTWTSMGNSVEQLQRMRGAKAAARRGVTHRPTAARRSGLRGAATTEPAGGQLAECSAPPPPCRNAKALKKGQRIEVWWAGEQTWFAGTVLQAKREPLAGILSEHALAELGEAGTECVVQHEVEYDDGDVMWHNLGDGDEDLSTPWGWKFRLVHKESAPSRAPQREAEAAAASPEKPPPVADAPCPHNAMCVRGLKHRGRCKLRPQGSVDEPNRTRKQPRAKEPAPPQPQNLPDACTTTISVAAHHFKLPPPDGGMAAVHELLRQFQLETYATTFNQLGFDDLRYLLSRPPEKLRDVAEKAGMKLGHAERFVTFMQEVQGSL